MRSLQYRKVKKQNTNILLGYTEDPKKKEKGSVFVCVGCHNKIPQTGQLRLIDIYFLTVLEARSVKARRQHGWFLVTTLFLACRELSSQCVPIWPLFCAYTHTRAHTHRSLVSFCLLIRTPVLLDQRSFNLNQFLKTLYSNIVILGLELQRMNFEGTQFRP